MNETKGKYFVEECDIFSSHFDHDILGYFDDLEESKELCNKKAKDASYFNIYRVYKNQENTSFLDKYDNCIYEVKGVINTSDKNLNKT